MIYVTADLHGIHPKEFQKLLERAQFSDDDFLFILGDVIDRGEYGAELLAWLTQQPNMELILGNHEGYLLTCGYLFEEVTEESLDSLSLSKMEFLENWLRNGGGPTLKGFQKLLKQDPELVQGILEYLRDCPLYEEVEVNGREFVLVHSGLGEHFALDKPLWEYETNDFLFTRPSFQTVYYPDKTVVFGHTPTACFGNAFRGRILRTSTWICIDTGVYAGNSPALLCLDTMQEYYWD